MSRRKSAGQVMYESATRLQTKVKEQAAEIQRLRAAMVHAMDDCSIALGGDGLGAHRTYVQAAHTALKTALETP